MELCCFGYQAIEWMGAHETLAGWAQFFGAIVAIGIAIWAGGADGRHHRRIQRERRDAFLRAIEDAAQIIASAYEVVGRSVDHREWLQAITDLGSLRHLTGRSVLEKALAEPLSEWPTAMLYVHVQNFAYLSNLIAGMADDPLELEEDRWNANLRLMTARISAFRNQKSSLDKEVAHVRKVERIRAGPPPHAKLKESPPS